MKIKDISNIINKNIAAQINENNIINFYKHCVLEEKIDAYYVNIDVVSINTIKFKKSNKELTQVDLIINKNWSTFINDWKSVFNDNKEAFASLVGFRINLFFFPNSSPLSSYYKEGFRYIIKNVSIPYMNNQNVDEMDYQHLQDFVDKLKIQDENLKDKIKVYKHLSFDNQKFLEKMNEQKINPRDYSSYILNYIDKNELFMDVNSEKAIKNNILELIFRNGKSLYQLKHRLNNESIESTTIEDKITLQHKQIVFELVLQDFIEYASKDDETKFKYIDLITKNYVESVNNIFLHYISSPRCNVERYGLLPFLSSHFSSKDLTPPCLGLSPELNLDYVNDDKIKQLLTDDKNEYTEWIINIYKVLLVNLKQFKKSKYIHYLSKNEINSWNEIVKSIDIRINN